MCFLPTTRRRNGESWCDHQLEYCKLLRLCQAGAKMSAAEPQTTPRAGSSDDKLPPRPPLVRLSLSSSDLHPVKGPGLTEKEKHHDERIRTLCFVMMACAVLYYLVLTLRDVLVPFFLALAIKYVLTPLIDLLSCRHREDTAGQCSWRLHRGFAIFIAMMLAAGMLSVLGVLVVRSVAVFASNAETYSHRLAEIVEEVFAFVDNLESFMHHRSGNSSSSEGGARGVGSGMRFLQSQLDTVDLGVLITVFLDHAAEARHSPHARITRRRTTSEPLAASCRGGAREPREATHSPASASVAYSLTREGALTMARRSGWGLASCC